jgi:hypothetical protein
VTATASTLAHATPPRPSTDTRADHQSQFDIYTLVCAGERRSWSQLSQSEIEQLSPKAQDMRITRAKAKCKSTVVYMVFPPDSPQSQQSPLPLCNQCFNEYFESHEIEADMVMRLSDDEDDFTTGDNRSKKHRRVQHANEPICQVPRSRR